MLDTATTLIRQGRLDEASEILDSLDWQTDANALGPLTALGVPRRLQAVRLRLAKARGDAVARCGLQMHLVPPPHLLADLFEVDAAGRLDRVRAASAPVPQALHQVWVGSIPPPETVGLWQAHAGLHGWTHHLWTEEELRALGVTDHPAYRAMSDRGDLPGVADVARYAILAKHGGVYLDCDWLPVGDRSLRDAIPMSGLSAMAETVPRLTGAGSAFLNNSILASPAGHPAFERLLDVLPEVIARLPHGPAWWVSGPLVFTLAARAGPVTVLDALIAGGKARTGAGRQEALDAAAGLSEPDNPALLYAWKPW